MVNPRWHVFILLLVAFWCPSPSAGASVGSDLPDITPRQTETALQQTLPEARDLRALAGQYRLVPDTRRVVNVDPPVRSVGQVESFWVSRQNPTEHFRVQAELRLISRHAYWYVQTDLNASETSLRQSADVFDTHIYPGARRLVGSEAFPGIDNDPRITIFNGAVPGVAGYVWSPDSVPRSVHPYSNEREIVYLNLRSVEPGTLSYQLTLAHEFTHLVHQNVSPSEDTWIREGLADFVASELFPQSELAVGSFFATPDVPLTSWSDGSVGSPPLSAHYQSASWFLRYFTDRFGEEALARLLAREHAGAVGADAFLRTSGLAPGFAELFRDWTVANLGAPAGARTVVPYAAPPRSTPLIRHLEPGRAVEEHVSQYGTVYYEVVPGGGLSFAFGGSRATAVTSTSPRGRPMWYAGRSDTSVSTLSRTFDLSGAATATLSYWIWYDIERDYDFGYVAASIDDGRSWRLLESARMSRANETGNNLGIGYTGTSGDPGSPLWVFETVDLTPFAGQIVSIRFSYVTDDAFVREGMGIDEIRVDAPGGVVRPATDDSQWIPRGWSRVGNSVVQTWLVTVVRFYQGAADITRIPIDDNGQGHWSSGVEPTERIVVAISGTAPVTTQKAAYRLRAERD